MDSSWCLVDNGRYVSALGRHYDLNTFVLNARCVPVRVQRVTH
jgi:hypothetical protein